uniref:Uncharacterized protein n=1 Tax=Knipowitschia caucasica TaxID=637954 RepID=A0AAV2ML21_KNICA
MTKFLWLHTVGGAEAGSRSARNCRSPSIHRREKRGQSALKERSRTSLAFSPRGLSPEARSKPCVLLSADNTLLLTGHSHGYRDLCQRWRRSLLCAQSRVLHGLPASSGAEFTTEALARFQGDADPAATSITSSPLAAGRPSWPGCRCVPCQSTVDGEGQEEAAETRRLRGGGPHPSGDMNLCWNEIKRKSHNIRVRLEAFSDNSGKLQLSLQEIIEWLTAKDEELSEQLPIGGDVGAVQHQREFHQVGRESPHYNAAHFTPSPPGSNN